MKVTVRYFASARKITGRGSEECAFDDGSTVEDLLQKLSKKYGREFEESVYDERSKTAEGSFQFLVDGRNVQTLDGLRTPLHEGCTFSIIPPLRGG